MHASQPDFLPIQISEEPMADLIDPDKMLSVAQIAKKLGYSSMYLTHLAADKKFKAWRIGNTWASTVDIVEAFLRTMPPPGRPKTKRPRHK
jgi:hypothetical protein